MIPILNDIEYGKKLKLKLNFEHSLKCLYLYNNYRLLYNIDENIYLISVNSKHFFKDKQNYANQHITKGFFIIKIEDFFDIYNDKIQLINNTSFTKKRMNYFKIYYPHDISIDYNLFIDKNRFVDLIRKIKLNFIENQL